jgi:peptidoglycan/LPS O-acetylase OafA/YrhL
VSTERPVAGRASGRAVATATIGGVVFAAFMSLNPSTTIMARGGFVVVLAAIAALLLGALEWPGFGFFLAWSPLQRLGRISYGVYLWHAVIYWYLRDARPTMPVHTAYNLVCVVVSFAVAAASFQFFEAPLRRRITQRFTPGRSHPRVQPLPALAVPREPLSIDPTAPTG